MRWILVKITRWIFSQISNVTIQHFFGVSQENFGCARKISFLFIVISVNFRIIENYQKEDLGDEDLFYDEVISDANGELFNSKNQYANCICRPNNLLITTFFFSSISVMVLLFLRVVFKSMHNWWRLSHKQNTSWNSWA